jgi:hypothetical protein
VAMPLNQAEISSRVADVGNHDAGALDHVDQSFAGGCFPDRTIDRQSRDGLFVRTRSHNGFLIR